MSAQDSVLSERRGDGRRRRICESKHFVTVRRFASFLLLASVWASSACSSPPARRSVLLITIDTLRYDHVTDAIAPELSAVARSAVVFENAISVGPLTLPSHASLFTGQIPPAHGVRDNHIFSLAPDTPTYTAWLKAQGYDTAAFVSAVVLDRRYGLDAGFDAYDDAMPGDGPERSARETLRLAEQWLTTRGTSTKAPFFLWIHLFEPHAPYATGSYAGEVAEVDRELGRFFTALRSLGLWDDTVLGITSDHGESLGEHGEDTHGFFVYDATIRIPWTLRAPGLGPGRFPHQVRLLDVMPTMIALADVGGESAALGPVEGVDLAPSLASGGDPDLDAYAETWLPRHQFNWSELKAIRTASAKYIEAPDPELYRWREDPGETRNLVSQEPDVASRLREIVARASASAGRATRRTASDVVEAEKFLALGYIGQAHVPSAGGGDGPRPDPKSRIETYQLVMSALTLSESGRPDEALQALERAERLEPDLTQVHYLKGTILGAQERYREAAAALERTVSLNPRHVLARFKLAMAYFRLGDSDRAEATLEAVIDDEPRNMRAYQNLATIAYARGDLTRAESLARRAIEIDDGYFDGWNTLGAIYVMAERSSDAVQALNRAVAIRPSSGQAHYNLALALQAQGQTQAAAAAAERACALDQRFCQ